MLNLVFHQCEGFFCFACFFPKLYCLANKTSSLSRSYNINKVAHQAIEEILKIGEWTMQHY